MPAVTLAAEVATTGISCGRSSVAAVPNIPFTVSDLGRRLPAIAWENRQATMYALSLRRGIAVGTCLS